MSSTNCKIFIIVNGQKKEIPENSSLLSLLDILNINKDKVVIELNKVIVKKDEYKNTILNSSDELEIVTFVGGG